MAETKKGRKLRPSDARPALKRGYSADAEPIAIVGIGCRFPGGANSPEVFWRLLCDGVDTITDIPPDRPELRDLYDPTPGAPGKIVTREGGFLADLDRFDPYSFGISPREAACIDPQQRLLLEVAWEAFEDAGIVPVKAPGNAGVFIGMWTNDYEDRMRAATRDIDLYTTTGGGRYSASGRLSFIFDLRGPSMTIDTACSSSLVAVHLACESLRKGETELALAGGVNLILQPYISIGYSKSKMLSPDARCKFGDAHANGYVRSEGAGIILLKPLRRALADRDSVYAVILGSAVNNDGHQGLFVAPSRQGQESVLRQAYRAAGMAPARVHYIEAHGTGTAVGDPVEIQALGTVLAEGRRKDRPFSVGSIKTNIGHTEAASGIAGLIKAALCVKHRIIPPSLHLHLPSPSIPWHELPLRIPQEMITMQTESELALAGVNSFGVTGTNAHVVLQEAPQRCGVNDRNKTEDQTRDSIFLLPLSAPRAGALGSMAQVWKAFLAENETANQSLRDICYSASVRRNHHDHRATFIGKSREELIEKLEAFDSGEPGLGLARSRRDGGDKLVFVFAGQGPQWFAMGRNLLEREAVYRGIIQQCDELLRRYSDWSLLEELTVDESKSRLDQTEIAQPAIFALQVGLAALWRSWGIGPDLVIGHSVGEVAAAHVSGALCLEDAVTVIYHRGRLMQWGMGKGKMASVELSEADASDLVAKYGGRLAIAAVNSPTTTVISGEFDALKELLDVVETRNVASHLLSVNYAFHSPQMDPYQSDLVRALKGLKAHAPSIPMISTVTGKIVADGVLDAVYWGRNIREPVRFADAVTVALSDDMNAAAFLEISPHPVLAASVAYCASHRDRQVAVLASLRRGREDRLTMLTTLGQLYCGGHNIAWPLLYSSGGEVVKLPAYPWQRERYWIEEQTSRLSPEKLVTGPVQGEINQLSLPAKLDDWLYEIVWEPRPRGDQTSGRGLAYLPAPGDIVADLRSHLGELGARHDLPQFLAVAPHLEKLTLAYALHALQRLGWEGEGFGSETLPERLGIVERHRRLFFRLLEMLEEGRVLEGSAGQYQLGAAPSFYDPKRRVRELLLEYPQCGIELELVSRCGERLADVLTGRCEPLQLLFPENASASAENLYCAAPFMKTANALVRRTLELTLKDLPIGQTVRILEIGAGTGGTTEQILPLLPADRTEYVFTDVSNSFLIAAAQKFLSCPFIQYRLLDLERQPAAQGFAKGRFDIVIAANVLHATTDLTRTLRHVKDLLASKGLLVLVEGTGPQQWLDLIFGMLAGWWKFADKDLRSAHPLISQKQWSRLLADAEFEEAAIFPDEGEEGLRKQCVISVRGPRTEQTPSSTSEWLIFGDKSGIAGRLTEFLRARGESYILVSAGPAFERIDAKHWAINLANPEDFERVLSEVHRRSSSAALRIVHLWSLNTIPIDGTTAERLEADQLSLCGGVVYLVRAMAKHSVNARLWLITRGAQPVRAEPELLAVSQSTIWGLGRVIALEHPEFWGGLIDLDENMAEAGQIALLRQEIGGDDSDAEDQIAFRDNQRYVPRLMRCAFENSKREAQSGHSRQSTTFAATGAYLITGGLGKLGLILAHWMAKRGARHLVLVSRRRFPDRSTWSELAMEGDLCNAIRQIQAIESLGVTVTVVRGDVADVAAMSQLFQQFGASMPNLRGVIHAAGVFEFHSITKIDTHVLEICLHPKITGAWVLHELTKHLSLDLFIVFSSTASVWGVKGLGHYAAANQFTDALAHYRQSIGLPSLTINWGRWDGGGMTGEAENFAAEVGLEAMCASDALEALECLLATSVKQIIIAACNWNVLKPVYEARRHRPLFERVSSAARRPELQSNKKPENFLERLRQVPSSEQWELVRAFVHDQVATVLGVAHAQSLDAHQGFFRMGMDSLMSVQLRKRLEASLNGHSLPLTLAFEYPNIEALTKYLAGEVLNLDSAVRRTSTPVNGADAAKPPDRHDRLSENELVDLLAKKLEQLK